MKCSSCGKELENTSICQNCGAVPDPEDALNKTVVTHSDGVQVNDSNSVSQPQEEDHLREALSGKYEIIRKLGAGGMASVYLAREISLDRMVAIKLLPMAYANNEGFVTRFSREARIAANLEHPNIVAIHQIGREKDISYFVMSYIPGGTLGELIEKEGALPVDKIISWGMDICSALGYAHSKGVIHRDLKADNIMIDRSGRAIVTDFGIARAAIGTGLTLQGDVIGTPQFMSPEQAMGKDLDARSDIYTMGLLLYQMSTGKLPFQAVDAPSLMYMHVHQPPEPPDVHNPGIPPWLRNIILKCLEKKPDDRFSSSEELRKALEEKAPVQLRKKPSKIKPVLAVASIAILLAAGGGVAVIRFFPSLFVPIHQPVIPEPPEQPVQVPQIQEPVTSIVDQDDFTFQQAEMVNTKQAFFTYLAKYPEGKNYQAALSRITEFEEKEAAQLRTRIAAEERQQLEKARTEQERLEAESARQDNQAFIHATTINTRQSFSDYIAKFPKGRHVDDARSKIAEIEVNEASAKKAEEESRKRDEEAFRVAERSGTVEAFSTYMISFSSGRFLNEARARIAALEKSEKREEEIRLALSALSIRLVSIPAGNFQIGAQNGDADERPVKNVSISAFNMSATEITQSQYRMLMGNNPSFHRLDDNCPVERVTWREAIQFCNRLSEKVGLEPCYDLSTGICDFTKNGFRLPTEAEWEYACRGNMGTDYNTGEGEGALARAGWYRQNSQEKTHPVGLKAPNTFGLYDMHGNVWEWTNDFYNRNAYNTISERDPSGPETGSGKVVRGGSWLDSPRDCRSAKRRNFDPEKRYSDIGFRVVRR